MKDIDILLSGPMMPRIEQGVAAGFIAHRPADAAARDALIAEFGTRIRGMASVVSHGRIDGAVMDRLPRLEVIANMAVGYDNIDVAEAQRRGIVVTNTPDVLTEDVADMALGLLLAAVRQIPQADRFIREGRWAGASYGLSATLRNRNVGILGLGRIGAAIARRCESFGMSVAYHGRQRQAGSPYTYVATPLELAEAVDVLIVATPGGAGTYRMVDAAVLKALGPQGVLVNIARGSVVDETALLDALRSGSILAAGLDVHEGSPKMNPAFWELANVVLTPHIGSATNFTRNAMAQLVVDNLTSWFSGHGPLTPVPETPWKGGRS